ncbi:MAG: Peptidoglycan glycosyltransferase [Patescibacteria group bacterium]|nr:Peptidoglycan glycosyltransferase [Patescibacteria group bacterium]
MRKIVVTTLESFGLVLAASIVIAIGALLGVLTFLYADTPDAKVLGEMDFPETSTIYDRTGEHILYEIHGNENRKILPHDQIPDIARLAAIAAEDDNFYNHNGFDAASMVRAARANVESGKIEQGGSTITQQLARNVFFTREKTFERKIKEVLMAVKIENNFSKDEILDAYLNNISYGSNVCGIGQASEWFFGKKALDLTLDEAALLAALPKATTYYSPHGNHKEDLIARKEYVLRRMAELGLAGEEEARSAMEAETLAKIKPLKIEISAPHFVFYVIEQLEKEYGQEMLEAGGLRIITTLDWELQKLAEETVKKGAEYNEKTYGAENASLAAVNPKTGEILAMAGSRDFFDGKIDGQVNVATSLRQPGSSFKPFAYAKAFEKGYQPETYILDIPTDFGRDGSGKNYIPKNYDGKFHGLVTMRSALSMSLNIPAVKTLSLAGVPETIELAERLGITTLTDKNRFGLSLVLGGGDVKLLEMTGAYGVFANDGKKAALLAVAKIVDGGGQIVFENKNRYEQVLDVEIARRINSILSDTEARKPIFGNAGNLRLSGRPVAAKTGTTQEYKDGWTVGYTNDIAAGVWAGNNDSRPMKSGSDGVYSAAPIWHAFMEKAAELYPKEKFTAYQKVKVDEFAITGKIDPDKYIFDEETGEMKKKKKKKDKD